VITALAGQGMSNFDAAVCGVYVHGLAGDIAADELGQISLMATDIIDALPAAFAQNASSADTT
jgi:NAD(P)H-hydrate epimerase